MFLKKTTHIVGYFFQTLEFPEKYFIGNEKHQIVCFDIFSFLNFAKKFATREKLTAFDPSVARATAFNTTSILFFANFES